MNQDLDIRTCFNNGPADSAQTLQAKSLIISGSLLGYEVKL